MRQTRAGVGVVVLIILILLIAGGRGTQATPEGQASAAVGRIEAAFRATLVRGAQTAAGEPALPLQVGDVVRTTAGGAARITLTDGSALQISDDSELRVARQDRDTQQTLVELLHGHVQVTAAAVNKPGGFFRVRTPTALVGAIGTDFDVQTAPGGTAPMAGSVDVASNGTPVANAALILVVANLGKVAMGSTDAKGRRQVAVDPEVAMPADGARASGVFALANLGKVQFHAESDECPAGQRRVYLVASGANMPELDKGCRRRKLTGEFAWTARRQRIQIDVTRGTCVAVALEEVAAVVEASPRDFSQIELATPGGAASLAAYREVGTTRVTCLSHFLVVASVDASVAEWTYLLPGQSSIVYRGEPPLPATRYENVGTKMDRGASTLAATGFVVPAMTREFDAMGRVCDPTWVVNGDVVTRGQAKYDYRITGLGISTGTALSVAVTNQSPCALYFLVTDGAVFRPRRFLGRSIVGALIGSDTSIGDFQRMVSAGGLVRVPASRAGDAGGSEGTLPLRSYCVELHKLAPHPSTEYRFGEDDDVKQFGWTRVVVDRAFYVTQTRELVLPPTHGVDTVLQWALWSELERLNEKSFLEEYGKLLRRNYEAQKKKFDKDAERQAEASGRELRALVDHVLN
jgi:hypothetical protein